MKERISNVQVKVIDCSKIEKDATKRLKAENDTAIEANINLKLGYAETSEGCFVFCSEGIGSINPISNPNNSYIINIFGKYKKDDQIQIDMMPAMVYTIKDENALKELPISDTENLTTFIRSFGRRLEDNFDEWNKALSDIIV